MRHRLRCDDWVCGIRDLLSVLVGVMSMDGTDDEFGGWVNATNTRRQEMSIDCQL